MAVDPTNSVVREIHRRARRVPRRNRRRYEAAALQTGAVESGFRELPGGDADSQNWRQERASVYGEAWRRSGGALNTRASVDRFFNELAQHDRGQPSYELAADVQRPAAQYRGRYREHHAESLALINRLGGGGGSSPPRSTGRVPRARSITTPTTEFDQAAYDKALRRQKVAQLLQSAGRRNSVLFRSGLLSTDAVDPAAFTSTSTSTRTVLDPTRPGSIEADDAQGASSSEVSAALHAARKRLGITEDNGTNRSRDVDKMQRGFGMVGQPWCGIYLGTVLREAGVNVDSRVASVAEVEAMARQRTGGFEGGFHSAKHARAGDALITRKGQHVAFVERVDPDGTIHVIGGNQGSGDVSRRTWKPEQVYGVARPRYRRR